MRRSLLFLPVILAAALPVLSADCSCTAPDGSCSASISCGTQGCLAICGNDGGCVAECSKDPVEPVQEGLTGGGRDRVNIDARHVSPAELSRVLSNLLGEDVVFTSDEQVLSVQATEYPAAGVVKALSRWGAVVVQKQKGNDLLLSLQVEQISGSAIAAALSRASGREISFQGGPLNIDIQGASLPQVLGTLARFGAVTLDGREVLPPR